MYAEIVTDERNSSHLIAPGPTRHQLVLHFNHTHLPVGATEPPGMEGGGGVDAAGGGVHKWRLAHVCAFAFLLHLKPSEPHIGALPSQPPLARCPPREMKTFVPSDADLSRP